MSMDQELASMLHGLAATKTEADHRRVINATSPTAGKALTRVVLELHRQGLGPGTPLPHAQLLFLAHPDSTHANFIKVAADQHGEVWASSWAASPRACLRPWSG